jgi:type IV pilus assembly protein PilN
MIRINLLPQGEGKSVRRRSAGPIFDKTKVVPIASLSVVLTACLAVLMLQSAREKSLEQEVAVARAEAEKYKKTIALIDEMVRKENELNRRLDIVRQLDQNRFRTVAVLDEMAKRVPNYLWLTSVKEVGGNKLAIDGLAFSNLVISDLMSNLEGSKVFDGVDLSIAKRKEIEKQSVVSFTLTTAVAGANPAVKAAVPTTSVEGGASTGAASGASSDAKPAASDASESAKATAAQPSQAAQPASDAPVIQIPAAAPAGAAKDQASPGADESSPAPEASSESVGG